MKPRNSNEIIGNVESDPEYQLIVEVNSVAVEIDSEICMCIFFVDIFTLQNIMCLS